jgi:hypothetical protein
MESAGAFSSDGGGQADQLKSVTGATAKNSFSTAKAQNMLSADKDVSNSNTKAASTTREQKVLFIADQDGCIARVAYDTEEIAEPSTYKDANNTNVHCTTRQQKVLFIADQDGCIVRVAYDTEETAEPSTAKDASSTNADCTASEPLSGDQDGRIAGEAYTTEETAEPSTDKDASNTNADCTTKEQTVFSADQDGSSACTAKEQNEFSADRDASIASPTCIATTQTESSTSEHGRVARRAACTDHEMTTEPSGDKDASFNTVVFVEMEEELFSTGSDQDARATTAVCNTEEMTKSTVEQDADVTKGVGMGEALKESSDRQEFSAAMPPGCVVKPQKEFSAAASGVASNTHAAGAPKASEFHTVIPVVAVCASSAANCPANVNVLEQSSGGVTKRNSVIAEGAGTGDISKQQERYHELKHPHAQLPLRQIQQAEVQAKKERVPCLFTCKICEQVRRHVR